jgi:hypothetical protein
MSDLSDHVDRGGFCSCCGTLWPCGAMRRAFLAQRAVLVSAGPDPDETTEGALERPDGHP